jgi:hypothetical protein
MNFVSLLFTGSVLPSISNWSSDSHWIAYNSVSLNWAHSLTPFHQTRLQPFGPYIFLLLSGQCLRCLYFILHVNIPFFACCMWLQDQSSSTTNTITDISTNCFRRQRSREVENATTEVNNNNSEVIARDMPWFCCLTNQTTLNGMGLSLWEDEAPLIISGSGDIILEMLSKYMWEGNEQWPWTFVGRSCCLLLRDLCQMYSSYYCRIKSVECWIKTA